MLFSQHQKNLSQNNLHINNEYFVVRYSSFTRIKTRYFSKALGFNLAFHFEFDEWRLNRTQTKPKGDAAILWLI